VLSQDANFNPIYIVAEYEVTTTGQNQINAGGHADVHLLNDKAIVGATLVHEAAGLESGNLQGLNASYKLTTSDTVKVEVASSKSTMAGSANTTASANGPVSGSAQLGEWDHIAGPLSSRVFYSDQGTGFGLGQQSSITTGLRTYGASEKYQFTPFWSTYADVLDQLNLASNAEQRSEDVGMEYRHKAFTAKVGLLVATTNLNNGSGTQSSDQATVSGSYAVIPNKMNLTADANVGLKTSDDQSFPNQVGVGADYQLTKNLKLNAGEQLTWAPQADTASTSAGMVWAPWAGGNFNEALSNNVDESGDRIMSSLGLGQSYKLTPEWTVNGTYDRADTLKDIETTSVLPNAVAPIGTITSDFWAASVGGSYKMDFVKGTMRLEYRDSTGETSWNAVGGVYRELDPQLAVAGGLQVTTADDYATQSVNDSADLRWSIAFRPNEQRTVMLNRLDLIVQTTDDPTGGNVVGRRVVNNLNISERWTQNQLSLEYGSKYVLDTIDAVNLAGYTDLTGVEWRHDMTERWDWGAQTSIMHSWSARVINYSYGISLGLTPVKDTWVSVGFNFAGVSDPDFPDSEYMAKGIYLKVRAKFDQESVQQIWGSARGVFQ